MTHSPSNAAIEFWQKIDPAGTYPSGPSCRYHDAYPALFSDGKQLVLPIRERDGGRYALASLIINQASFQVVDTLATALATQLAREQINLIVGIPTLGLTLAEATARKLGHTRYIALSTSRKFWYDDALSVPMRSVTSPDQQKHLYIDPRLVPLLKGRRLALVDDVVSTGSSMTSALRLLSICQVSALCIGCAMRQTTMWRSNLAELSVGLEDKILSPLSTPRLVPHPDGGWMATTDVSDQS